LAIQTRVALNRVGLAAGTTVYTEGGFRNNGDYNSILATLCPEASFALSGMDEATSFGAALLGWATLDDRPLHDLADTIDLVREPVQRIDLPGLERYADRLIELANR
jgi:hypothetical protein